MNEEEIIQILKDNQISIKDSNYKYCDVVTSNKYKLIANTISANYNSKLKELEAKVYIYENAISNSNFKALILKKTKEVEE